MAKPKRNNKVTVTWAQAFRDIINKAMDRGQLLPILFFFVIMFLIYKMPPERVYEFGMSILQGFKDWTLVGWGGMGFISILWAGHARIMRRKHSAEYLRIGGEKSKLQQDKVKAQLGSSDSA
ncbi:conserved hypothetical protein [Vibrio chagasii]|uniref:hypothetical protein n=1 Tax=Vibrio chagasii TaxID=170679 RepID=UPI00337B0F6B|nr:conserved hypothetical protein [Vibrio chagasii]CAH7147921.1 conserved hypothetical protein [Vibrio chagasii]